jgi:ABC-type polysaccharide transport system permease subunit
MGRILDLGFEKVFLMQSPLNLRASEVIATHVYKVGLAGRVADFSYGTAIGLFQSLVGLALLLLVNTVVRRTRGMGL